MNVGFHPAAIRDTREITAYYREISPELAIEFQTELEATLLKAAHNPGHFHPAPNSNYRRANLKRFPYHALYGVKAGRIRVFVVKHHKREPSYGLDRK